MPKSSRAAFGRCCKKPRKPEKFRLRLRLQDVGPVRALIVCLCIVPVANCQPAGLAENQALPKLTDSEMERFLLTAEISNMRVIESGATKPYRATLSDGKLTHDAQIQFVDESKAEFKNKDGSIEKDFRDSYKFNIAAYRADRLVGLSMTPVTVERSVNGKPAAVTWWLDDVLMTELERRDKNVQAPDFNDWTNQYHDMRVFDELIGNFDRNQGNLLITKDWKLWTIDHTRSFRTVPEIREPKYLVRCDHRLLDRIRKLTEAQVKQALQPYLDDRQIWAFMSRRDKIVAYLDSEISSKGADAVLTGMPRSTQHVSVP